MRTSFHHQPEAQHQKSPAIETPVGRLPHLLSQALSKMLLNIRDHLAEGLGVVTAIKAGI